MNCFDRLLTRSYCTYTSGKAKLQCCKVKRQKFICRVNVATMTFHSSCIIKLYRALNNLCLGIFFTIECSKLENKSRTKV